MKTRSILETMPFLCFNIFAVLIAGRDIFTQKLLLQNIDPIFTLFVFCLVTTIVALVANLILREKPLVSNFYVKTHHQRKEILLLGVFTWLAFMATIFGIRLIGAPIFSLVEHALIPLSMAYLATRLLQERFSLHMRIGLILCTLSVLIFIGAGIELTDSTDGANWTLGIVLAVFGSILTALTSVTHKKFSFHFEPEEFLILRFTVPTLALATMLPFSAFSPVTLVQMTQLAATAIFGFALPLVFLCFGFIKSSLSRFSGFILLIPLYTFLLGEMFVGDTTTHLQNPVSLLGIFGLLSGYVIFEWESLQKMRGRA